MTDKDTEEKTPEPEETKEEAHQRRYEYLRKEQDEQDRAEAKRKAQIEYAQDREREMREKLEQTKTPFQKIKTTIRRGAREAPGVVGGFLADQFKQSATDFLRTASPSTTRARRKTIRQEQISAGISPGFMSDFWARPQPKGKGRKQPTGLLDSVMGPPQYNFLIGQKQPQTRKKKKGKKVQQTRSPHRDPWDLLL